MAIKFNRSQTFATNGTVTAAGLHNLVDGTDIYQALITDQTAMTSVGSLDKLLIADSDLTAADAPRSVTVNELFEDALTLSTYTNIKATNATITTGTVATLNSTTATIPTLTSITKITSGTGTAAAPAISPTGDTNTGIFFPAADTVAFAEGGTEAMRIDSSGNVGIGTTSPAYQLNVQSAGSAATVNRGIVLRTGDQINFYRLSSVYNTTTTSGAFPLQSGGLYWEHGGGYGASGGLVIATNSANAGPVILATADTERLRIDSSGNVGIGTGGTAASSKLDVYGVGNFQNLKIGKSGQTGNRNAYIDITGDDTYTDYGLRIIREDAGANANTVFLHRGTGGLFFSTTEAGPIVLRTTGTERLRIASAGQIGIGGTNYGTSGQVLTSAGASAAPSWQTISGITSGTAVASTSGTAIDFTGIPSTAKKITVIFNEVGITATDGILIQIGDSGGIENTGYISTSVNTDNAGGSSGTSRTDGYVIKSISSPAYSGLIQIANISGNIWIESHSCKISTTTILGGGGSKTLSAVLDRVRITTISGTDTFNAGSVNIMYEG